MAWEVAIVLTTVLILALLRHIKRSHYWTNLGIKQLPWTPFPFGNYPLTAVRTLLGLDSFSEAVQQQYEHFEGEKCYGVYSAVSTDPILVIRDLDLVESILVRDFDHFVDRTFGGFEIGRGSSKTDLMWKEQMLSLKGNKWRTVRGKFSPLFTSGKIKLMSDIMQAIGNQMTEKMASTSVRGEHINLNDVCSDYSMHNIANCVFGVRANAAFVANALSLFSMTLYDGLTGIGYAIPGIRSILDYLQVPIMKPAEAQFFTSLIMDTMNLRRSDSNATRRNDLVDLMLDATANGSLDETKVVATCILMLVAGFDSTAASISYCLYYMTRNERVQERLRTEMNSVPGELLSDYNTIKGLVYLDMVVKETLRLHPPLGLLTRQCTKDYVLPGTNVGVKCGQEVFIPIDGIHRDERYFPDAQVFDPDRFKAKVDRHPMAFLPFSHGPRMCIGKRFAEIEIKIAVVSVLSRFRLYAGDKTPRKVNSAPHAMTARPKETLWIMAQEL